jgi:hypothetical protein
MDKKRRRSVLALLLVLSIGNYFRIRGQESISAVQFISVFVIGALAGILVSDLVALFRTRKGDADKMV